MEFAENWRYLKEHPLEKAGDILVLAGDIGYFGDENYSLHPFWNQVADQYEQVIVVPGNHEFYKYDVDMILSTLWAHIPLQDAFATESGVTDFHRIMFLHSSCHPRILKEAVSTVPLFQMKMTSSRLVALTIGFTATLTGTLTGRLGRHSACLISLGMYLPRSTNRLIAGR